jgi:tetrahydromethanopterin S-methyltransferase subunit F
MTTELYEALIEAGTSKEKAALAAKTTSIQENKLTKIELMIIGLYASLGVIGIAIGYIFALLNTIIDKLG